MDGLIAPDACKWRFGITVNALKTPRASERNVSLLAGGDYVRKGRCWVPVHDPCLLRRDGVKLLTIRFRSRAGGALRSKILRCGRSVRRTGVRSEAVTEREPPIEKGSLIADRYRLEQPPRRRRDVSRSGLRCTSSRVVGVRDEVLFACPCPRNEAGHAPAIPHGAQAAIALRAPQRRRKVLDVFESCRMAPP